MSPDPGPVESACVQRIQRMRNEVDIFNKCRENSYGPISHALENLPRFSLSPSEWSEDHLCRFQVVINNGQTDEALFPNEYVVSHNDKTLKAIAEDGFFVSTDKDLLTPAMSRKMYSGFFMDLLQLSAKGKERTATSRPISESNTASTQSQQKVAIARALEYAKGLSPATETSQLLSHSLFHNFLKYVASMEHLAYPDLPFWCPSADSESISIEAAGATFVGQHDGAVYTWVRRSTTKQLRRKSIPLCFIECKMIPRSSSEDILAQEAADVIALGALNWRAEPRVPRPRDKVSDQDFFTNRKAFVLCCHRTSFHASTASVSEDYLTNLARDSLSESQYLFLNKGEDYELSDAAQRYKAVKQILGIMRCLTRFPLHE